LITLNYFQVYYNKPAKTKGHQPTFGHYDGHHDPLRKLLSVSKGSEGTNTNDWWANEHMSRSGDNKWVFPDSPEHMLFKTPQEAVDCVTTIANTDFIPEKIASPNYGDNWGKNAVYLEINPRILGKVEGNRVSEGIMGAMKLLPAVPLSNKKPTCVVLSQLYPIINGDGYTGNEHSLYTTDIKAYDNYGISRYLSTGMYGNGQYIRPDEAVKAFNDLAHLRGLKTGIRMNLSEGQLRVNGNEFNWSNNGHQEAFIQACTDAIDMGFDSIFFDSAKHIENYDGYYGVGRLPDYAQMQYITQQVRARSGRSDVSLVGEMCDESKHFTDMGLTTGSGTGETVSNDNDGSGSYEESRRRIKKGLNGHGPVFMQIQDIMPLNVHHDNIHDLMINCRSFSAYGDCYSHWNNVFEKSSAAQEHRRLVNDLFK